MRKKYFASICTILLLGISGLASLSYGQIARYKRATGVIEIDFGTASIKVSDVQRIYLQNAAGASSIYTQQQVKQASGSGLKSYVVSLQAPPNMPADLSVAPVQLDILVKPDPAKNDISVIPITVEEINVVLPYKTMLSKLQTGLAEAEGKDDAELYFSGSVTTAVGSKPNWVADAKYEREFAFDKFPFFVAPFFNLAYDSKVSLTDKLTLGVKFIKTFGFKAADPKVEVDRRGQILLANNAAGKDTANFHLLRKARVQRQYFQYAGTLQFESDWDFRVNNIVSSQELRYLLRPHFSVNSAGGMTGKVIFSPFVGAEVGRNIKNPLSHDDRAIGRLKAGGILTLTSDKPFGGLLGKQLIWENTFTQRWLLLRESAFDKDDDGNLRLTNFGRLPKSHFKSSLEFKINDYFGPVLTYEWGKEPPLYDKVDHQIKFGLVYSFSRKPLP